MGKKVALWSRASMASLSDDDEVGVLAAQFRDYADGTSIHGVKYTCEPGRTAVEKLLWVVLVVFSVALAVIFMVPQLQKMKNSPFIMSVSTTNYPIWEVDFPAVTICSNNKIMDQQLKKELKKQPWNQTHLFDLDPENLTGIYSPVKGVLERYVFFAEDEATFQRPVTEDEMFIIKNQSKAIPSTLRKVMHRCKDMMLVCLWQGTYTKCTELFAVMRTDSGFCCSFNAVNQRDQFAESDDFDFDPSNVDDDELYYDSYGYDYFDEDGDFEDEEDVWFDEEYYDDGYWEEEDDWEDEEEEEGLVDEEEGESGSGSGEDACTCDCSGSGQNESGSGEESGFGSGSESESGSGSGTGAGGGSGTGSTAGGSGSGSASGSGSGSGSGGTSGSGSGGGTSSGAGSGAGSGSGSSSSGSGSGSTSGSGSGSGTSSGSGSGSGSGGGATTSGSGSGSSTSGSGSGGGSTSGSGSGSGKGSARRRKRSAMPRRKRSTTTTTTSTPKKIRRTNSASTFLGLSVLLYPNSKAYNVSLNNYYGFKILVHSPYSFPEPSSRGFAIGQGTENFIGVSGSLTQSTDAVKSMSISRRDCVKHDDDLSASGIELKAFLNYSYDSCLLECRAELLFQECGCLPYYFPDFSSAWGKNTVCDLEGLKCIGGKTKTLHALNPDADSGITTDDGLVKGADCRCLNDCDEIIYTQEMSSVKMKKDSLIFRKLENDNFGPLAKAMQAIKDAEEGAANPNSNCTNCAAKARVLKRKMDEIKSNSTLVHIYYKELGIILYTRDQIYGPMDALAAFGGIVGLCMGFSILSGFELLYFFTLRLFVDRRRKREEMEKKRDLN